VAERFSVDDVAEILRRAEPNQPWKYEAPVRHYIRQALVLAGDKWWHADRVAFVTVARARQKLNIRAPVGGDSDYDMSSWSGSADCVVCDKRFIPKQSDQVTCCKECWARHRYLQTRPVHLARCRHCNDVMDVTRSDQKYCSRRCLNAAYYLRSKKEWGRIRNCQTCGGPIPDTMGGNAEFCSQDCFRADQYRKRRERRRAARGAAVPTHCAHCAKPLPTGANLAQRYCDVNCKAAAQRARKKLNGHANEHAPAPNGSAADHRSNGSCHPSGHPGDHPPAGSPGTADLDEQRMLA
jgi:hypothetical protein